jgi:hypothetical protein
LEDGKPTKETLRSLKVVSDLNFRAGNKEKALNLLSDCVEKAKESLGVEHKDTEFYSRALKEASLSNLASDLTL